MATTLAQLKARARSRADMINSEFISDEELTNYLNQSMRELYDILVSKFGDEYFTTHFEFVMSDGEDGYTFQSYKITGLDRSVSGPNSWIAVPKFNFDERNIYNNAYTYLIPYGVGALAYRWLGDKIWLIPSSNSGGTYRLWYVPDVVELVEDIDTLPFDLNRWQDYIVVDAAIKMKDKEESDVNVLMSQKMALLTRIEAMSASRDAGEPEVISDVRSLDFGGFGRW